MACCTGDKIPYEELFPEELKSLRKNLTGYVGGNVGQGATPYGGEIAAGVNPASNAALNMVMGMMGHGGYSPPQGFTYTGGQQGSPVNPGTPPPVIPGVPPPGGQPGTKLPPGYDPYDPTFNYVDNPKPWWDQFPGGVPPWQV